MKNLLCIENGNLSNSEVFRISTIYIHNINDHLTRNRYK